MQPQKVILETRRPVKLVDLHPEWVAFTQGRHATALIADRPCACDGSLIVPFINPIDGGPPDENAPFGRRWTLQGETFEDLTIEEVIRVSGHDELGKSQVHWEGHIIHGTLWPSGK
jgi:hypothetical protein